MGARTAVLVYTDGEPAELLRDAPDLDPEATKALIAKTNPAWAGTAFSASGSLGDVICPGEGIVFAGVFPGIEVLCDRQLMIERPSQLPARLLAAASCQQCFIDPM